jgi:hypothetical protein
MVELRGEGGRDPQSGFTVHRAIGLGRVWVTLAKALRVPAGWSHDHAFAGGRFPLYRVADLADRAPASWRARGGVVVPMYQREALALHFEPVPWRHHAVKVAVDGVDAVTGQPSSEGLDTAPQNYLALARQFGLDDVPGDDGALHQIVAPPLDAPGGGSSGEPAARVIEIALFEPKPGLFPDQEPPRPPRAGRSLCVRPADDPRDVAERDASGRLPRIRRDWDGLATWDQQVSARVFVHLVNSHGFRAIAGHDPPLTGVTPWVFRCRGIPWADEYDLERCAHASAQSGCACRPAR